MALNAKYALGVMGGWGVCEWLHHLLYDNVHMYVKFTSPFAYLWVSTISHVVHKGYQIRLHGNYFHEHA